MAVGAKAARSSIESETLSTILLDMVRSNIKLYGRIGHMRRVDSGSSEQRAVGKGNSCIIIREGVKAGHIVQTEGKKT